MNIEVGKRYRLSQVGTVCEVGEAVVYITRDDDSVGEIAVSRELFEWEELEPVYQVNAYYVDTQGDVYQRRDVNCDDMIPCFPWRGGNTSWAEEVPQRPLRKLDQSCWPTS